MKNNQDYHGWLFLKCVANCYYNIHWCFPSRKQVSKLHIFLHGTRTVVKTSVASRLSVAKAAVGVERLQNDVLLALQQAQYTYI